MQILCQGIPDEYVLFSGMYEFTKEDTCREYEQVDGGDCRVNISVSEA